MEIVVNGEARLVDKGSTLAVLVAGMGLARRRIALECNAEIVPRSAWSAVALVPGDRVEIVRFVGGG